MATQLKTFAELKMDMEGKWPYAFQDLAPELAEAMGANGHHVSCPVHGGGDGFRLFKDFAQTGGGICNTCGAQPSGFGMLAWVKSYSIKDATREIAQWLRGEEFTPTIAKRKPPMTPTKPANPTRARVKIAQAWKESQPLQGTPGELYFKNRGIWAENIPKCLRFHPAMEYFDNKTKTSYGKWPCILAPVKDKNGTIMCLHRTFITTDGKKAPVPDAKKLMQKPTDLNGCAIPLYPAAVEVLGLAEGAETALAAHAIARIPVWSCVNRVLLEQVEIPASVQHVVIFADLDRSKAGEKSAEVLAERLIQMGKTVEILLPDGPIPEGAKGVDWLDVLISRGLEGFPERWRNYRPAPQAAPTPVTPPKEAVAA